jgi:MFS family permease
LKSITTSVFHFTEFKDFLTGRFLFVIGLRMLSTLMGWWLYEITGSVLAIGMIGLVEVIPALGLTLRAGYTIDKSEKRKLLLTCIFAFGICVIAIFLLSLLLVQKPQFENRIILLIYFVIFCTGIIRAYAAPTFQSITAMVVSKDLLPTATIWSSATWIIGSILGHAFAGFSIAFLGVSATLIFIISLIFCSFYLLFLLHPKPATIVVVDAEEKKWKHIAEGIKFVFSNKIMRAALSLDLLVVFFGGIVAIVPAVAKDVLHTGPIGFAWLNGSADIGSAIMVIFLLFFPPKRKQGIKLFITIAVFGISIIVFAVSHSFILSFIALFISGMADAVNSIIRGTIIQLKTADHMRGRVMSINSLFTNSSNELGRLESGVAASFFGIMPSIFFGGIMTLLIVLVTLVKTPALRKMEY